MRRARDSGRPARTGPGSGSEDWWRHRVSRAETSSQRRRECRRSWAREPAARTSASPDHSSPSLSHDRPRLRVRRGDVRELDVDVVVAREHGTKRVSYVTWCELRGRHLVQQRLELVVVVAVDQRDVNALVLDQARRAPESGKSSPDDHDVGLRLVEWSVIRGSLRYVRACCGPPVWRRAAEVERACPPGCVCPCGRCCRAG